MLRTAIAVTALLLLAGCGDQAADVARDGQGRPTEVGEVRADRLRVGDCFDDQEGRRPTDFTVRPCAEPHANEVFAAFEVEVNDFPGVAALTDESTARCGDAFEGFVGRALEGSEFRAFQILPSEETWEESGDRTVLCALFPRDLGSTTGSAEGSGR